MIDEHQNLPKCTVETSPIDLMCYFLIFVRDIKFGSYSWKGAGRNGWIWLHNMHNEHSIINSPTLALQVFDVELIFTSSKCSCLMLFCIFSVVSCCLHWFPWSLGIAWNLEDLRRGVTLPSTLQKLGLLWRKCPLEMSVEAREKLWRTSKNIKEFDVPCHALSVWAGLCGFGLFGCLLGRIYVHLKFECITAWLVYRLHRSCTTVLGHGVVAAFRCSSLTHGARQGAGCLDFDCKL